MEKFLLGLLIAVWISYLAYRAQLLNRSGGMAAAILGTVVFGLGGIGWALVLLSFFFSSSLLSKLFKSLKRESEIKASKGSRRDGWQVLANGGIAGFFMLVHFLLNRLFPGSSILPLLWVGFAACLAGANADTWATELGLLNPGQPVLISTFRRVPKGSSGAISLVGTLASLGGSALIGVVAVFSMCLGWIPKSDMNLRETFAVITACGVAGALVDSFLGATVQAIYYCPDCAKETEQHPRHRCGTPTTHRRGLGWFNNDWVNGACTLSAGLLGLFLAILLI